MTDNPGEQAIRDDYERQRRAMVGGDADALDGLLADGFTLTAVLTARTMTEATIWGAHGTWRLQLRVRYARDDGS